MTRRPVRTAALLGAALVGILAATGSARAFIVFDPSNYAQNVLTAARALQQINNQIQSLQNQAQMLVNQGRNLTSLPYSAQQGLQQEMGQISSLLSQATRIAYSVQAVDQEFARNYPTTISAGTSDQTLVASAQARWLNSVAAFQHEMDVQAGVVATMPSTQAQAGQLVTVSQGAVGVLQAAQAGNQLLALQSKQLADLTALLAAQGRAQALDAAGAAAAKADAQARFQRFLSTGQGYQPQSVQMFH
ncbi:P-type conjugative transfer protein TrbJ [Tistlia consotensis]|uniref:P-type conjugative transfer protein TrbJ n=1 Tax=Tistlia consotensis USBA 355 TaxID=560819 RepID=A0A1Y6CQZ1_9PROT|nr:P-type conjugative transfer protein TrbJ [Tistlia consotensis]SMF84151.1 P-type conjugative transfer protein TrbJ [Tistlia consotensis USBA 355]SNS35742.1 P-type conjugative transfer protein TrbJ [Tistlia consotensis]